MRWPAASCSDCEDAPPRQPWRPTCPLPPTLARASSCAAWHRRVDTIRFLSPRLASPSHPQCRRANHRCAAHAVGPHRAAPGITLLPPAPPAPLRALSPRPLPPSSGPLRGPDGASAIHRVPHAARPPDVSHVPAYRLVHGGIWGQGWRWRSVLRAARRPCGRGRAARRLQLGAAPARGSVHRRRSGGGGSSGGRAPGLGEPACGGRRRGIQAGRWRRSNLGGRRCCGGRRIDACADALASRPCCGERAEAAVILYGGCVSEFPWVAASPSARSRGRVASCVAVLRAKYGVRASDRPLATASIAPPPGATSCAARALPHHVPTRHVYARVCVVRVRPGGQPGTTRAHAISLWRRSSLHTDKALAAKDHRDGRPTVWPVRVWSWGPSLGPCHQDGR